MDTKLFATVLGTVFLAEIGDKTQLATVLFAADPTRDRSTVFLGASAGLVLAAGLGVLAGGLVGKWLSPEMLRGAAGIGFIAVGIWTLFRR